MLAGRPDRFELVNVGRPRGRIAGLWTGNHPGRLLEDVTSLLDADLTRLRRYSVGAGTSNVASCVRERTSSLR